MAHQTAETLPSSVAQIAATNHLGSFSREYRTRKNSGAVAAVCLVTVGGMLAFTPFSLASNGIPAPWWLGILLFLIGVLISSLGSIKLMAVGDRSAVYLFEKGIIYSQARRLTALLWSQIASCEMRQRAISELEKCIVRTKDGRTFLIGKLAGHEELGNRIQTAVKAYEEHTL